MGWSSGGGDEVRAAALKLCQEVCVWANELGEEALSQEAWPRERPVVLASPPHTHPHYNTTHTHTHMLQRFTHYCSAGVITHCSLASTIEACAHTRLPCMHSSVNRDVTPNTCGTIKCGGLYKHRYFCLGSANNGNKSNKNSSRWRENLSTRHGVKDPPLQ